MTRARCTVTDHFGREWSGELLHLHRYPRRVLGKSGFVERIDHMPQRVGLLVDGVDRYFTVPPKVVFR